MLCRIHTKRRIVFLGRLSVTYGGTTATDFKYSFDLRNFVNTNKSYFGEWKKKTRVMVLMTAESEMFVKSSAFRNRVLSMIEDPLEQLELQFFYSLAEVSLNFPGGARKITVEGGKIRNVSISCNHIVFRNCIIQNLRDCPPFRKFELRNCTVQEGDLNSLTILEEADFSPTQPSNSGTPKVSQVVL
jgi:hypothetical protein